jgi:hypothetical protein
VIVPYRGVVLPRHGHLDESVGIQTALELAEPLLGIFTDFL